MTIYASKATLKVVRGAALQVNGTTNPTRATLCMGSQAVNVV